MIRYIPLIILAGLLAEIASLVIVGRWIGVAPVLLLVIGGIVAGIILIRTGGMSVAAAFRQPPRPQVEKPNRAVNGVFRVVAGLLMIVPGFVSDAAGLCLLLPPVQRWIAGRFGAVFDTAHPSGGPVIEAEAVEVEDPQQAERKRLER